MKTTKLMMCIFAICTMLFVQQSYSQGTKKVNKKVQQLRDQAAKMNKKGAMAVVGFGIADAGRIDLGEDKAKSDAFKRMSEQMKAYVENMTHDFREEVGVGPGSEHNDVFNKVINVVGTNIIKAASIRKTDYYNTKANKEDGTLTYVALLVVSPDILYKSLENELKKNSDRGSKENLYQRFVDSDASKKMEDKIKKYKEEFGQE